MARADFLAALRERAFDEERRPPVPAPPAPADRVLALQRAAGNHAVAALLGQQAKPARPVLARGRLTNTIDYVEEKWNEFKGHSDDMEDVLMNDFGPLLAEHIKGAGMTKQKAKENKAAGIYYDPDKPRAMEVAQGLQAWVTSASEGAERYYAEMRQAVVQEGKPSLNWQFGVSDITEPDVHTQAGRSIESKRTASTVPAGVDTLIREARFQSTKRVTMPDNTPFTAWGIAIEIDADNPWPYTATELNKAGVALNTLPWTIVHNPGALPEPPGTRANRRNLAPQKGSKKSAVPPTQVGKHEIIISWLKHNLTWKGNF